MTMGYKGDSYMDAGYFYAPYVPLTQTPVVLQNCPVITDDGPLPGILPVVGKSAYRSIDDDWCDQVNKT